MTAQPIRIRLAERADIATLAALRLDLFRELGRGEWFDERTFVETCRGAYADVFAAGRGLAWLADSAEGPSVATLTLLVHSRMPSPRALATSEGYITGVYTRPDWRRRGLATELLRAATSAARQHGLARVRLNATEQGREVYEKEGYVSRASAMELSL